MAEVAYPQWKIPLAQLKLEISATLRTGWVVSSRPQLYLPLFGCARSPSPLRAALAGRRSPCVRFGIRMALQRAVRGSRD